MLSCCFVVDLFPSRGERPTTLARASARSVDLLFGNQTTRALNAFRREQILRQAAGDARRAARVVTIGYDGGTHDPGPQKLFDFSSAALAERWQAGHADMEKAVSSYDRV